MDGVLTDFEGKFVEVFQEDPREARKNKEFSPLWEKFVKGNHFEHLNFFDGATDLLNYVREIKVKKNIDVEILSSSGGMRFHNIVAEQKKIWLKKNGIALTPNIVSSKKHKSEYATPSTILIDDTPEVIQNFEDAGGIGILHRNSSETITILNQLIYRI